MPIKLYPFQQRALEETRGLNRVAYYLDMGLGKTFVGSEKALELQNPHILVVCQKSKVQDWVDHFKTNYGIFEVCDLTDKHKDERRRASALLINLRAHSCVPCVLVINYELIFRREELLTIDGYTLILDESQLIQNETAKRTKFIQKMHPENVILLSGTPTSGKYEQLWSQVKLLGWNISKDAYWNTYVDWTWVDDGFFVHKKVNGYKNVPRLKRKLGEHGAIFMKLSDAGVELPEQIEQFVRIPKSSNYDKFMKESVVEFERKTVLGRQHVNLVGNTLLAKFLYARQLCGQYSNEKIKAMEDLIESTAERLVIFYNFNMELEILKHLAAVADRPVSEVNGRVHDLKAYEESQDSITLVQYQAGAMGLNLQKAHQMVYFTLPFGKGSSAMWEQSKKRIHRIGQTQHCHYYYLMVENSIEWWNLKMLQKGEEYNAELFRKDCPGSAKLPFGDDVGSDLMAACK